MPEYLNSINIPDPWLVYNNLEIRCLNTRFRIKMAVDIKISANDRALYRLGNIIICSADNYC
jgi:hypothetical protein